MCGETKIEFEYVFTQQIILRPIHCDSFKQEFKKYKNMRNWKIHIKFVNSFDLSIVYVLYRNKMAKI